MSAKDPGVTAFLGKCSGMLAKIVRNLGKDLKAPALAKAFPKGNSVTFAEHESEGSVWTLGRRPAGELQELTRLESRIYLCVKAGLSNKEIGTALGLEETTVAAYLHDMFKRFRIHSRTALAACSVLLDVDEPQKG